MNNTFLNKLLVSLLYTDYMPNNTQPVSTQPASPPTPSQPAVPPTPVSPNIPQQPQKRSNRALLLGAIFFMALGALGYWTYQNYYVKQAPTTTISEPTPEPTQDTLTNWKTYSQKDVLPISFKYPSNLVINVRRGDRPVITIDTKMSDIPDTFDSPIAPIEIWYDLNSNSYTKAIENAKTGFDESSLIIEKINNNGTEGTLISGTVIPGMRSGKFIEAYFDNGINPAISFWYEGYSETFKNTTINEEVFTQIVKTVSLISNQTADQINLKTYSDETFKFSFKYSDSGTIRKLSQRDDLLLGGASYGLKYGNEVRLQASEVYVWVFKKNGLSLDEWIKANSTSKPFGSEEKEFPGYVYLGQKSVDSVKGINFKFEAMGVVDTNVAVEKGEYIFVIGHVKTTDDLSKEYNQVLSTFKFTN